MDGIINTLYLASIFKRKKYKFGKTELKKKVFEGWPTTKIIK